MYRIFVILRHTLLESVAQPVFTLMILLGSAVLIIFAQLPFFTLGDDTRMFKSVAMDVVLLLTLITTLLATSRCIYEEIEDRTMLTLMSKPVARWEVLVGKYLGLIAASAIVVLALGVVLWTCVYYRIPGDYYLNSRSVYAEVIKQLADYRAMHLAGVYPGMVLVWLQVAVLAAVSVAISTRAAFVVNLPLVLLIYLAGNMTKFIEGAVQAKSALVQGIGWLIRAVLPYLSAFDRDPTVYPTVKIVGTQFADEPQGVLVQQLWQGVGVAALYAACYVVAALCLGMLLFRHRELGGAEG